MRRGHRPGRRRGRDQVQQLVVELAQREHLDARLLDESVQEIEPRDHGGGGSGRRGGVRRDGVGDRIVDGTAVQQHEGQARLDGVGGQHRGLLAGE